MACDLEESNDVMCLVSKVNYYNFDIYSKEIQQLKDERK